MKTLKFDTQRSETLEKRNFIGGAAVVASHIRALGAQCELVSVIGEDNTANLVKNELTTIEEVERVCLLNETQSEES